MMHALIWSVVAVLLACWSLLSWAAHALVSWPGWRAGNPAAGSAWIEQLVLPAGLAPWLPAAAFETFKSAILASGPLLEGIVGWLPIAAAWIVTAVWVVWALGSVILLVLGALGSGLVAAFAGKKTRP